MGVSKQRKSFLALGHGGGSALQLHGVWQYVCPDPRFAVYLPMQTVSFLRIRAAFRGTAPSQQQVLSEESAVKQETLDSWMECVGPRHAEASSFSSLLPSHVHSGSERPKSQLPPSPLEGTKCLPKLSRVT